MQKRSSHAPRTPGSPASMPNGLPPEQALRLLLADRDRYWRHARQEIHRSARELLAQREDELERGLRYRILLRGNPARREIALTFDDGPHPTGTPALLEVLRRARVQATFFVVGEMAERYPDLVRAQRDAGMEVGNHTYHHVSLPRIPAEFVLDEIKACGSVIRQILGRSPHWFRPPGGQYDRTVAEAAEALGYRMALWTDDPGDYAHPDPQTLLARTLRTVSPGGILLLHDGIPETVAMLPRVIATLRRDGYTFVSLDQLMGPGHRPPASPPREVPDVPGPRF